MPVLVIGVVLDSTRPQIGAHRSAPAPSELVVGPLEGRQGDVRNHGL